MVASPPLGECSCPCEYIESSHVVKVYSFAFGQRHSEYGLIKLLKARHVKVEFEYNYKQSNHIY